MCHEASGSGVRRHDRRRQGHGHARRLRARRRASSSSARTRAPTIRACSANCAQAQSAARRSSRSTRCASAGSSASPTRRTSSRWRRWARHADQPTYYFQLRVGGDFALVKGMMKRVDRARGRAAPARARPRLHRRAHGRLRRLRRRPARRIWDALDAGAGPAAAQIARRGRHLLRSRQRRSSAGAWASRSTSTRWPTIQMLVNLLMLRGNIGRPGAGLCPVRGHSNVQGDRTMGIWEKPPAAFLDALARRLRLRAAARARLRRGRGRSTRCSTARARSSSRWAATSRPPRPTRNARMRRTGRLRSRCTSRPSSTAAHRGRRQALILPSLGRTEIDVQAGPARRDGRGLDEHGARIPGMLAPASGHLAV